MRISKWVAAAVISMSVAGVAMAEDAEAPREACVEIPCFDTSGRVQELEATWKSGEVLQDKLIQMEIDVSSIGAEMKTALGVAEDASLDQAIADLKETAGDKLTVSMESGAMPTFSVADDAPENVKTFAAACTAATEKLQKVTADVKSLEEDITKMGTDATEAAGSLNAKTMKENGLKAKDLKTELSIAKNNKAAAEGLKDRSMKVVTETTNLTTMLAGLAG